MELKKIPDLLQTIVREHPIRSGSLNSLLVESAGIMRNQWCRGHRHQPLAEQHHTLSQKIKGHCAYYGITGNASAWARFRYWTVRLWWKWLGRRNRERTMTWERFGSLWARYPLPPALAVRSTYRPAVNP